MTDNDLILEIEESIKQDRLAELWEHYGAYLIAGAVLIVLITAFNAGWKSWNERANAYNTNAFLQALDQENKPAALTDSMISFRPGQKALALFTAAGLLVQDKKYEDALIKYRHAAKDETMPPLFRDLATLMAVRLAWAQDNERTVTAETLLNTLKPLWLDEKNPWRWHAHLQGALLQAHGRNDYVTARRHLHVIINANGLPPSLKERARALDHIYALKQDERRKEGQPAG